MNQPETQTATVETQEAPQSSAAVGISKEKWRLTPEQKELAVKAIKAIGKGPKVMKMYMEMCARCGTCAEQCPIYYGSPEEKYNPVVRSDLIRNIYKKHCTLSGKIFGGLVGAKDFDEGELEDWVESFYACTGCRRCATFCPFGIDNSVITRTGRAILDKLGLTPPFMLKVIEASLETGNTDGASEQAFKASVAFLEEEMKDEHGIDIKIPIDVEGAEYFYVPPAGDVLVNPEATTGVAKVMHVLGLADKWTMSSKCFDGANYGLFTGDDVSMKKDNKMYVDEAKRLGTKTLLMGECGHAYRIMKMMMEAHKWWGDLPFEITNVLEWTADHIKNGKMEFDKTKNPQRVTYHDPCNFARSCDIAEGPRVILEATCSDYKDMTPNRAENWCCGGGGGLSAMDSIQEFRMNISGKKKMEQIREVEAKYVATACSNCKRQLGQLMEYHKEDIEIGGVHDMLSRSILINGKAAVRTEY